MKLFVTIPIETFFVMAYNKNNKTIKISTKLYSTLHQYELTNTYR